MKSIRPDKHLDLEQPPLAQLVVDWQKTHGRHSLPWQSKDPYRVWLSEIMLQQTQVATVLRYYSVFLQRFPDIFALAAAPLEDVLAAWSGLGYYSRARNLQRTAQIIVTEHAGVFPNSPQALTALPGIGVSTANAIAAFCFQERVSILDANVRRVLARVFAFAGNTNLASEVGKLWRLADACLPQNPADMPAYTQGLMDLGAQVCRAQKPQCELCPLQAQCKARIQNRVLDYPHKKNKVAKKAQTWWLLWMQNPLGQIYLEPRPAKGIWGGLFSFPSFACRSELDAAAQTWSLQANAVNEAQQNAQALTPIQHVLTHRVLHLHPVRINVTQDLGAPEHWFTLDAALALGLPAPIRKLLLPALPVESV